MGAARDAISGLDLAQQVTLLAGFDAWHTVGIPDAGIPVLRVSDGPAGVRGTSPQGPPSASFPCGTAMAASFDPPLIRRVGEALGRECRAKSAQVLLGPTVNLHRTPVGGRNFECMSEDPYLTARLAVAYVQGVQSTGVACCIKHFVANDTEFERMTISSEVDEATLRELYLVPFEAAVREAGVRCVMTAYNKVNGTYASEHVELVRGVLRDEWGFDGVVISDWFGLHATAEGLAAGVDLEMPGPTRVRGAKVLAAIDEGVLDAGLIAESATRLGELIDWTGAADSDGTERSLDDPAVHAVAREAAVAGMVLLRNEGDVLPLASGARVALVGPNAHPGHVQGGGSAGVRPERWTSPLRALQGRGVAVTHETGGSISLRPPAIRGRFEVTVTDPAGASDTRSASSLKLVWMDRRQGDVDLREFEAVATGEMVVEQSGEWEFSLTSVGASEVLLDDEVLLDNTAPAPGTSFYGLGSADVRARPVLEAGRSYRMEVHYSRPRNLNIGGLAVGAEPVPPPDAIERAARAAAGAEVAVVVVGTNDDWESEGADRATLGLPGRQDELISAVAAANPRTVVVVNAGSPVAMPWLDEVQAVLVAWFPGGEFGDALADVLLGDAEPGGRLPVTFPRRLEDTPAAEHHPGTGGLARYEEGPLIGHRWYAAQGIAPLFPFGHGLGYTRFDLGAATVSGSVTGGAKVAVDVTNIGRRPGACVVQCYVAPASAESARPPRALAGFAKVTVGDGQTERVTVALDPRAFARWDAGAHGWTVPSGDYTVSVGTSSAEVTSAGTLTAP